jgi:hypothetical protein
MMTLEKAIQRAFDRCNLEGEDCEIYNILHQYKAIRELPTDEFEAVYDQIAADLGFCR